MHFFTSTLAVRNSKLARWNACTTTTTTEKWENTSITRHSDSCLRSREITLDPVDSTRVPIAGIDQRHAPLRSLRFDRVISDDQSINYPAINTDDALSCRVVGSARAGDYSRGILRVTRPLRPLPARPASAPFHSRVSNGTFSSKRSNRRDASYVCYVFYSLSEVDLKFAYT